MIEKLNEKIAQQANWQFNAAVIEKVNEIIVEVNTLIEVVMKDEDEEAKVEHDKLAKEEAEKKAEEEAATQQAEADQAEKEKGEHENKQPAN